MTLRSRASLAQSVLAQAHVLTKKHEELAAATGQNFNLFKILGRETDEVRTHSAIIAELLNPKGSHGQGPVFARLFAERFEIEIPDADIDSLQVWAEKTVGDNSRIDILMVAGDLCVVIENKIYAPDGERQIQRYYKYAQKWQNGKVVYLSLHDGDRPSDVSMGDLEPEEIKEIDCRSYETHVLKWLDDCIKQVARVPQIREILAHYEELVRELTGKSKGGLIMDLKELLAKKQDDNTYNFKVAEQITEAMTEFSIDTELRFWEGLEKKLTKKHSKRPSQLERVTISGNASNAPKEVIREVIRRAHGIRYQNKWRYGWTFRVKSKTDPNRYRREGSDVLLRVECDNGGWVFYGFDRC